MMLSDTIDRIVDDSIRIPSERILVSPDLYQACLDRIRERNGNVYGPDVSKMERPNVFVHGVPAVKCESLTGMEYALVPKER